MMLDNVRKVSKDITTTWLGVSGTTWQYHFDSKKTGERVSVIQWHEDNPNVDAKKGDAVLTHMKGDGRLPGVEIYSRTVIHNATRHEIDAAVTMIPRR